MRGSFTAMSRPFFRLSSLAFCAVMLLASPLAAQTAAPEAPPVEAETPASGATPSNSGALPLVPSAPEGAVAPEPGTPEAGTPEAATPVDIAPTEAAPAQALPHDLSPWSMFMAADLVVKSVMVGLALASLVTWTIFLVKIAEIRAARRRMGRLGDALLPCRSLQDAAEAIRQSHGAEHGPVQVAVQEARLSAGISGIEGLKERVASRLHRLEARAIHRLSKGTGILATIGSTAPFIGLFGTVWGIMNAFIGISKAQTTNLAVVAPGIAEALLATALGLVAAIPAVVIYNSFARSTAGYRSTMADVSAEILRLVSRDLDRKALPLPSTAAE